MHAGKIGTPRLRLRRRVPFENFERAVGGEPAGPLSLGGEQYHRVLRGYIPLMEAARQVEQIAALVRAYRVASTADCIEFVKAVGDPTVLFDTVLVPAINATEAVIAAE